MTMFYECLKQNLVKLDATLKRELLHLHYFHTQLKIIEIKYKIVGQKKQH